MVACVFCLNCYAHIVLYRVSLQTPLINEILMPLIRDNTSTDRSYPSGSLSRRTVACKLSDVLFIIAKRIGIDLLRQFLTEPLQLFFAVFSITSPSSGPAAGEFDSSGDMKSDGECMQTAASNKGSVQLVILHTQTNHVTDSASVKKVHLLVTLLVASFVNVYMPFLGRLL